LTVLTNLDPWFKLLAEKYEEAVANFIDLPYCGIKEKLKAGPNLVPNDWQAVEAARLKARRIL
jgi:hypothetical protein